MAVEPLRCVGPKVLNDLVQVHFIISYGSQGISSCIIARMKILSSLAYLFNIFLTIFSFLISL